MSVQDKFRITCLLLLISMLWHRQAIFESKAKGDKLSSSAEGRIRTHGLRYLQNMQNVVAIRGWECLPISMLRLCELIRSRATACWCLLSGIYKM